MSRSSSVVGGAKGTKVANAVTTAVQALFWFFFVMLLFAYFTTKEGDAVYHKAVNGAAENTVEALDSVF